MSAVNGVARMLTVKQAVNSLPLRNLLLRALKTQGPQAATGIVQHALSGVSNAAVDIGRTLDDKTWKAVQAIAKKMNSGTAGLGAFGNDMRTGTKLLAGKAKAIPGRVIGKAGIGGRTALLGGGAVTAGGLTAATVPQWLSPSKGISPQLAPPVPPKPNLPDVLNAVAKKPNTTAPAPAPKTTAPKPNATAPPPATAPVDPGFGTQALNHMRDNWKMYAGGAGLAGLGYAAGQYANSKKEEDEK